MFKTKSDDQPYLSESCHKFGWNGVSLPERLCNKSFDRCKSCDWEMAGS